MNKSPNEAEQAARDKAAKKIVMRMCEVSSDDVGEYGTDINIAKEAWSAATAYHAPYLAAVEGLLEALEDVSIRGKGSGGCAVVTTETLRAIARAALESYQAAIAKGEGDK